MAKLKLKELQTTCESIKGKAKSSLDSPTKPRRKPKKKKKSDLKLGCWLTYGEE